MSQSNTYDVIVVGFGAAGAAAAIEAAEAGARVLVLDRAHGGGASALSGGVVYAGGGTPYQKEVGYEDSPENMFDYLKQEVAGVVSDETLRRFCDDSPGTISWLERQGVSFQGTLAPYKTSYPTDRHYLYFSGNEKAYPYVDQAKPAPRGHRTLAPGLTSGKVMYAHLRESALAKGVEFAPLARVHDLIIEQGAVVGVRYRVLHDEGARAKHAKITKRGGKLGNFAPAIGAVFDSRAEKIWSEGAVDAEARAAAVILSAGGFVFNKEWMQRWAGPYRDIHPLGTAGDDGSGIGLGLSAGGTVGQMDRMTAWRFLSPPSALIEGVTVGVDGTRIRNEDLYGATHSDTLARDFEGNGRAVYDSVQWKKARGQIREQTQIFQRLMTGYLFTVGHKKADTLEELAHKTGVDPRGLRATVDAYNAGLAAGGDPGHKAPDVSSPVVQGPFYAIDISIKNKPFFPAPGLTLGGLRVDERTGGVLDSSDQAIPGLYAAGRSAVGICSQSYISGLSLADCLFSGRRAGAQGATLRRTTQAAAS